MQYYRVELWKGLKCARIAVKAADDNDARDKCIRLFGDHLSVIVGPVYDIPEIIQLDRLESILTGDALMAVAQPPVPTTYTQETSGHIYEGREQPWHGLGQIETRAKYPADKEE